MADNITTNPGAGGPVVAAENVGGVYYPANKLDVGQHDLSEPVYSRGITATVPVQSARDYIMVSANPTLTTSSSYAAGVCLGGVIEFTDTFRYAGQYGTIENIILVDIDGVLNRVEMLFYAGPPSTQTDHSPVTFASGDAALLVAETEMGYDENIGTSPGVNVGSFAPYWDYQNMSVPVTSSDQNLYMVMYVEYGSATFTTANSVTISLMVRRD